MLVPMQVPMESGHYDLFHPSPLGWTWLFAFMTIFFQLQYLVALIARSAFGSLSGLGAGGALRVPLSEDAASCSKTLSVRSMIGRRPSRPPMTWSSRISMP